jgi:cell division protein FtsB
MSLRRSMAWLLPFGLLVYAVFSLPVLVLNEGGLPRYRQQRDLLARFQRENAALIVDISRLEREAHGLRYDADTVERVMRDEAGWIRKGEVLLQFR